MLKLFITQHMVNNIMCSQRHIHTHIHIHIHMDMYDQWELLHLWNMRLTHLLESAVSVVSCVRLYSGKGSIMMSITTIIITKLLWLNITTLPLIIVIKLLIQVHIHQILQLTDSLSIRLKSIHKLHFKVSKLLCLDSLLMDINNSLLKVNTHKCQHRDSSNNPSTHNSHLVTSDLF